MEPIEITYRHEAGYGWYSSSPDLRQRHGCGLSAGGDNFEEAKAEVESVLRWGLEDESLQFTHCVREDSIAQYVAEHASAGQKTAA
ncbi:hypothetical protein [Baekduia sp. Peel2402]|uniref:hypothetical protein n=1 Tax=Baekduia sp. Peel2402 TaxID=3458296 RepID=UPI00403E551C